jgi:chromosome segregation ATPase
MHDEIQSLIDGLQGFLANYGAVQDALASAISNLEAINAAIKTASAERDKLTTQLADYRSQLTAAPHQWELANNDAMIRNRELVDQCGELELALRGKRNELASLTTQLAALTTEHDSIQSSLLSLRQRYG